MSKKGDFSVTERLGVHMVALQILKELGWPCREQFTDDWGIDAHMEVVNNGRLSGRLIAVQIKSGESFFEETTEQGFVFRGKKRHLDYWQDHSLPVVLMLYNPKDNNIYWEVVRQEYVELTNSAWKITVPKGNILSSKSEKIFRRLALPKNSDRKKYDYLTSLINGFTRNPVSSKTAIYATYASFFSAQHDLKVVSPYLGADLLEALTFVSRTIRVEVLYGRTMGNVSSLSPYTTQYPNLLIKQVNSDRGSLHDRLFILDEAMGITGSSNMNIKQENPNLEIIWATTESTSVKAMLHFFETEWA
jgi:hypothetical protein